MSTNLETFRQSFGQEKTYLDTATMGLSPRPAAQLMKEQLDEISKGTSNPLVFDSYIERSRSAFAAIAGVPEDWIAIIPAVSVATAVFAEHLKPAQRVLVAEDDFTSVLFPVLQAEARDVEVISVSIEQLIEQIDETVDWVAVSAVQSRNGALIDLDSLADACAANGVKSFADLTQAAGWLELEARRFDITATAAYKWLLSPRGSGFMTVKPELWPDLVPVASGWYAGENPWDSIYGKPLRLAENARRYDISPAWLCWAGAVPALEMLANAGVAAINRHNVELARAFSCGMGIPQTDSAIVSLQLSADQVKAAKAADIAFSERAGRSRFSFHAYNSLQDVELLLGVLRAAS